MDSTALSAFLGSYASADSISVFSAIQTRCFDLIHSRLLSGSLGVNAVSKDLSAVISALREKTVRSEEKVKAQRLKEAKRMKEVLERKLQFVEGEIEEMSEVTVSKSALSRHRSSGLADIAEELKRRKSTEFVRKLHIAQRISQRRKDLQASISAEERLKEAEEIQAQRAEREKKAITEREERVKSMQELAKRRREYLEEVRNVCKQTALTPPARSIAFPDLPIHPPARALKLQPSHEELKAHFQLYSQTKRVHKERKIREIEEKRLSDRVHATINGRHYAEALEERRIQREMEEKRVAERALAKEKQRRYADLVQEMYFPKVDPKKQHEIERRKLQSSVPRYKSSNSPQIDKETSSISRDIKLEDTLTPKPPVPRFPHGKKPVITPPRTPEPLKRRDYLAELRRESVNQSHLTLQSIQLSTKEWAENLRAFSQSPIELQAKLTQLETATKRHEVALSHLPAVDKEAIAAEAGLNSLLVHSIRAKLALLQK